MGWFEEQIRQREKYDQEAFSDSFVELIGSVLGKKVAATYGDELLVTQAAMEDVLKYYHIRAVDTPQMMEENKEDYLEFLLRPHGIMRRNIELTGKWYKSTFGPILGFIKGAGAVALLPGRFGGYYYQDAEKEHMIKITRLNAHIFEKEAICFYRPLPMRSLKIKDLLLYIRSSFSPGNLIKLVLVTGIIVNLGLLLPGFTRALTGAVYNGAYSKLLFGMGLNMIAVTIGIHMITSVQLLIKQRILTTVSIQMEAAVMMRVLTLPAKFFRKYSAGDLSNRLNAVTSLSTLLINDILMGVLTMFMSMVYVGQIVSYSRSLARIAGAVILLTLILTIIIFIVQSRISTAQMQASTRESSVSYAIISGIQKIRLAGAERRMFSRWASVYARSASLLYNQSGVIRSGPVYTVAISLIGNILIFISAQATRMEASTYYAFTASYGSLMAAVTALAGLAPKIAKIPSILLTAKPILEAVPEVSEHKQMLQHISGSVELSHVYFKYDTEESYLLKDISLRINAGEYVAIVGRTGCGKSTLLRLLLGFESPQKGGIFYDSYNVDTIDLRSLRRKIGTVMQNGSIFQGDIYSNIVISAPELTMDDAWEAAEIAGIADDIREMPMGMHTWITEGQGGISGGQKQRLMIARAIAPKPRLLLLDEATSALDNLTQRMVAESLAALKCTRIVVAHRLSTIQLCDRILFLEGGRIVEDGTYEELIALNGRFAELVERQQLE